MRAGRVNSYVCKIPAKGNKVGGGHKVRIRILRGGQSPITVEYDGKGPLSRAIWLSGKLDPVPLCAGIGRCGKCRVRFVSNPPEALEEEVERLGAGAVAAGWRLSCRCQIPDSEEVELEVPLQTGGPARALASEDVSGKAATSETCVWGFDLGTTSIAWRAQDARSGRILCEGQALNPQAGAGADVISRVNMAQDPAGEELLSRLVRTFLRQRMESLPARPASVVVAANTAMSAILLQADVSGLAHAPYRTSLKGNELCDIPDLGRVYLPPLPAPFVGGDITAGLAFLAHAGTEKPYLLADLGTNGEIALVCDKGLYLTSVPLGPALEGIGLECGSLAGKDVVTNVTAGPLGLIAKTADNVPATGSCRGISATGYLSLIDLLRRMGVMDEEGHVQRTLPDKAMPLARRLAGLVDWQGPVPRLFLQPGLWMSLADVEEILKVKAAFSVAVASLLAQAGLQPGHLRAVCLAGALGRHVEAGILENLGFVPLGCGRIVRAVGNSSLEGACLLASEPALREELAAMCAGAMVLAPAEEKDFHTRYVGAMNFAPWGEYAGKS